MDALTVGVSVQAALSGVADVMAVVAVVADKGIADPTRAKGEGFADGEALSLSSLCDRKLMSAEHRCLKRVA